MLRPRSIDELATAIAGSGSVRATGAGHSFMPLCASDDVIVSLEDMPGDLTVAADRRSATAPAGWSLRRLTAALWAEGLALANQGDVNPQSIAGSMATGTHGTGNELGSLSTFAQGFVLIDAMGNARTCDGATDPELFAAQRLSLGLFGIAAEVTFAVVPAFHLVERIVKMRWEEARERFDDLTHDHRHAEFWFFPHADSVILKTLDPCDPVEAPRSTTDMEEKAFRWFLNIGAVVPPMVPLLQRLMMRQRIDHRRRGPAYSIFPSDRTLRFEEMEYELPRAAGMAALDEVVTWIRRKRLPISFPFEYRTVAADDLWISPMHAGPVASISMHQYARMTWQPLFAQAEAIFRAAGGRPHWAKRHTLDRAAVDALYPNAERFRAVRRRLDPTGKFLNAHLAPLFS